MPKITFLPDNIKLEVKEKANLMAAIIQGGLPIGSSCAAEGICAKCVVKILSGSENLTPPNSSEKKLIKREKIPKDQRVSCQTKVLGDVTVTTTYW